MRLYKMVESMMGGREIAMMTRPLMTRPLLMMTRPVLIAAVSVLLSAGALAGAAVSPQVTEGAGFYRLHVGDLEITALSDGTLVKHADPADSTPVNAFLINTGEKLVLIDAGAGTLLGPGVGGLVGALRAAGYEPAQIDEIYLTDMLPDHVGGLVSERKAAFPRALVHASRSDTDYWLGKSSMASAPMEDRQRFAAVGAALKPYVTGGRLQTFEGDAKIEPAIRALPSIGSTPGPTVYIAESRGEKIVFLGDDGLPVALRSGAFKEAPAHGFWVAGLHQAFPGIGHVRTARHTVEWVASKKAAS